MIHAILNNGRIELPSPAAAVHFHDWKQKNDGRRIVIDIDKTDRSLSQLRMYRAWLASAAGQTGNDEEELHQFLLQRCGPRVVSKIATPDGMIEVEQIKRTSGGHALSMSKEEMSEFLAKAAALIDYPLPTREQLDAMGYVPTV